MTKFDLKKLKDLNKEIEILNRQMAMANVYVKANMVSDTVNGSSPYFPYVEHCIKITGVDVDGYERKVAFIRRSIARKIDEKMEQVAAINEYIESVQDGEMRNILRLRYMECMTWEEIGKELSMNERTAKRKYRRWWENAC